MKQQRCRVSGKQWKQQGSAPAPQSEGDLGAGAVRKKPAGLWSQEHWDPASHSSSSETGVQREQELQGSVGLIRPVLRRGFEWQARAEACKPFRWVSILCTRGLAWAPFTQKLQWGVWSLTASLTRGLWDSLWTDALSSPGHQQLKRRWVDPGQLEESQRGL